MIAPAPSAHDVSMAITAAAFVCGLLIGKFLLRSEPEIVERIVERKFEPDFDGV